MVSSAADPAIPDHVLALDDDVLEDELELELVDGDVVDDPGLLIFGEGAGAAVYRDGGVAGEGDVEGRGTGARGRGEVEV